MSVGGGREICSVILAAEPDPVLDLLFLERSVSTNVVNGCRPVRQRTAVRAMDRVCRSWLVSSRWVENSRASSSRSMLGDGDAAPEAPRP